jgi:hypothetical protein
MISHRTMVVILIVIAMLLEAGCVEHIGNGKNMGNVPSTVFVTSLSLTPVQTEPLQVSQDNYWINIDPISDKYVGENFTVTSTTNLSAGEEILYQVYSGTHIHGPKIRTWEFYGATGTVRVIQGINGKNNTISFDVNLTTLYNSSPLEPDEYVITENAIVRDGAGTALFHVKN